MTLAASKPLKHAVQGGRLWWLPAGGLWVGASADARAESALVTAMPSLSREAAAHADVAWR